LPASTSSVNFSPAMPEAVTIDGVVFVTSPMNPTGTPLIFLIVIGGSAHRSITPSLSTFAAR